MYLKAAIISQVAQILAGRRLKKLQKRSDETTCTGFTGHEVAKMVLERRDIHHVTVGRRKKSNHFNPSNDYINLTDDVYSETSVADAAIAAHEAGHAIQDRFLDVFKWIQIPIRLFNFLTFMTGLAMLGLLIWFDVKETMHLVWMMHFAGTSVYMFLLLFVEFDASFKAYRELSILGIVRNKKEKFEVINVLSTAFITYICAFLVNMFFFLNILL